jgi:hypothetical protein
MLRTQQWQGECSGLDPPKVQGDKSEAGPSYRGQDLGSKRISYCPDQIRSRQLDSRDLIVVTNSQIAESQLPQCRFGTLDLAQLGRCDRMVVGNPGGEARSSRLVGHLQAQGSCDRTDRKLAHASLGEWSEHLVVRGGARTWSVGPSRIVGIFPVRNRIQPVPVGDLVLDPAE